MTKQEFALIARALKYYYPEPGFLPTPEAVELWRRQLEDLDYKVLEAAVNVWASSNRWKPTIADLRQQALEICAGDIPDWGEAWEQVQCAIRRYGHCNPEAAYEMMDEITREAARRVGFIEICINENVTASRAAFRDIYCEIAARRKKQDLISQGLRLQINGIRQNLIENKGDCNGSEHFGDYQQICG